MTTNIDPKASAEALDVAREVMERWRDALRDLAKGSAGAAASEGKVDGALERIKRAIARKTPVDGAMGGIPQGMAPVFAGDLQTLVTDYTAAVEAKVAAIALLREAGLEINNLCDMADLMPDGTTDLLNRIAAQCGVTIGRPRHD